MRWRVSALYNKSLFQACLLSKLAWHSPQVLDEGVKKKKYNDQISQIIILIKWVTCLWVVIVSFKVRTSIITLIHFLHFPVVIT